MADIIRDAPLGQILRFITGNRVLLYPEERPDFELPASYNALLNSTEKTVIRPATSRKSSDSTIPSRSDLETGERNVELEKKDTAADPSPYNDAATLSRTKSRLDTVPYTNERLEVEAELAIERTQTRPVVPIKTADGNILVDWYTTDDPDNPQNWSNGKRGLVLVIIFLYTFIVYTGSAIYTSSQEGVMHRFNVNHAESSLPLSLYVLAYGIGPLLWAPLSEIPIIGRSPVYAATMALFTILSLPTAMVDNFAGLLVLRFLQGFFGSPCLANGAASMQDMYSLLYLPYALVVWVASTYCGPALGPLLSGFAVTAKGWRWSLWEILWAAGPIFLLMLALLPETSTPNILLRRAARLRKLTGDARLKSQSEIDQKNLKPSAIVIDAIIKPIEITIKDPAIMFVNVYTAIIYGIYYSFFEVFPLVYPVYYGFSLGMIGVVFTSILVSCLIGIAVYCAYLYWILVPDILKNGLRAQESRLVPALFACFGPTIGLFIFGWTARADVHWIVPTIGIAIYGTSVFVVSRLLPSSFTSYTPVVHRTNSLPIDLTMYLRLRSSLIPTIRRFPLRWQRFPSKCLRLWQYPLRQTSLHQPRCRKRCLSSWGSLGDWYHWNVWTLLLGRTTSCEI